MSAKKPKAICVLGMHRSGTSTVSRAVNLMGAYMGEECDIMNPAPDNPEGFWEHPRIVAVHDRILHQLGRTWDTTLPLPENWVEREDIAPLREELREVVLQLFDGRDLWGWKDPRTCLVLDLWKDLLGDLGVDLSVVYVVRSPLDVVNSLRARNAFSEVKALGMWTNYNLSALRSIEGISTVEFLSYDGLVENGAEEIRGFARKLDIELEPEFVVTLSSFVKPGLRHSCSPLILNDKGYLVGEIALLLAEAVSDSRLSSSFFKRVNAIVASVSEAIRLYEEEVNARPIADFEKNSLIEKVEFLNEQNELLEASLEQARGEVAALRKSCSWQITAPLRKIADMGR